MMRPIPRIVAFPAGMLSVLALAAVLVLPSALVPPAAARPAQGRRLPALVGRWDLTVWSPRGPYPAWLEVRRSGFETLVGSFVGEGGSVRPVSRVWFSEGRVRFALPPQWERGKDDLRFEGRLAGDRLTGRLRTSDGRTLSWGGVRAPSLRRKDAPKWDAPIALFNGRDLSGWKPRDADRPHGWEVRNGLLSNRKPGNDLLTTRRFTDFRLRAEFRYPRNSNSGIYLRGRYEVQIEDNYGQDPDSLRIGGVYGFLTPRINAARKPGEWQTYDIMLVGRTVTIVLNGETVIDRQEIPGITGGALDGDEGAPGPILLQGDHGPIEFRRITLIPAAKP